MGYIDRNLLPDERIVFRTKKHLIIFFYPVVWTIFAVYASSYMTTNPMLVKLNWMPGLMTVIFWASVAISYFASDFAVTNKRVMMREGFVYRHTNEMRLTSISQVNVDQSLLGQLLNYGTVSINAFGAFDAYTMIAKPGAFQRFVNAELDKLVK